MKKAVIFSGGTISDYSLIKSYLSEEYFVICADSGVIHCDKLGIKADMIVGDFDSLDYNFLISLPASKNADVITLNPVKDDTDTEYAIDCAVSKGFREVILLGGVGTRLDHTLANIFLMEKYYKIGIILTIINENNILHFVCNGKITIKKSIMKYISVLPIDNGITVNNEGFKYPLDNEVLYRDSTRGISNELTEDLGVISVYGGCAIVAETMD